MNIKQIIKRTLLGIFGAFLLLLLLFVVPYFANIVMPWDRPNAIESALEWGGLAELPENADDISVETNGNMFTRSFTVEFTTENTTIDKWVENSYGLREIKPTETNSGNYKYEVPGKKGSIGGTVLVDRKTGKVIIEMHWS